MEVIVKPALQKAIMALLFDIKEMRHTGEKRYWFGPFSEGRQVYNERGSETFIEWPNLELSATAVEEALGVQDESPAQ